MKRQTTYFSQGSAATDLRGGDSFNSNFLQRSLTNLTVKNITKIDLPLAEVIVKIKVAYFLRHGFFNTKMPITRRNFGNIDIWGSSIPHFGDLSPVLLGSTPMALIFELLDPVLIRAFDDTL